MEKLKDQSFKWQRNVSTLDDYSLKLKTGKEILDRLMPEEKELPVEEKNIEIENLEKHKQGVKKEDFELQLERSL
jgi:hypothetical protein